MHVPRHHQHQEMTDTNLEAIKSQAFPDHWSLFLHCTICFGFFHNPHTLECGHSFCKRCLKRLAEIARDDNPDVRLRRLSLNCPACRHPFPAKPVLTGRIRTCIVLKHLVELWKRECKILLSSPSRYRRSICSQTDVDEGRPGDQGKQHIAPCVNLQEEFVPRTSPGDDYFRAVMRRATESTDEIEMDQTEDSVLKILQVGSDADTRRDHSSSDSESTVSSSGDDVVGGGIAGDSGSHGTRDRGSNGSLSNVSIPDIFGRFSVSRIVLNSTNTFPARVILIGVWFIYSLLIVALAEAFLPYVILFTLFFFLIVLK